MSEYTDVVIVGAGPAGLMASLSLSSMGISHQIIDKLGTRALNGRADGCHVRTIEIWDSFDIASKLEQSGSGFGEWALWTPRPHESGKIMRQRREPTIGTGVSSKHTGTFHQGFIEAALIEAIKERNGPAIQRGVQPLSMSVDDIACKDHGAYPIRIEVEHVKQEHLEHWDINAHNKSLNGQVRAASGWIEAFGRDPEDIVPHVSGTGGSKRTIHAKYLIGADGGHSWIRHQLSGFVMEGAGSNSVWAVMDVVPITDFPDIRKNCTILSDHGTVLIIPREKGLVRLYIQFDEEHTSKPVASLESAQDAFAIAQQILQPYTIDYRYCDWFSVYTVGQRIANHFSHRNCIFLAGDAVHTHTPKGGQGMNVSQQDTYNLGWKLGGVIRGQLHPSALSTFESERRPVAHALVELDSAMSKVLTARSMATEEEVKSVYDRLREYGSGVNVLYPPSLLICEAKSCDITRATGLGLGQRIPDAQIVNHASGSLSSVHGNLKSTGAWRIIIFAGNLTDQTELSRLNAVGERLASVVHGVSTRSDSRSLIEVLLIYAGKPSSFEAGALHSTFYPFEHEVGYNYHTVFAADSESGRQTGCVYDVFGIDRDSGAMVIVRPDQMVAWIGGMGDVELVRRWLDSFMLRVA